jgi:hypothetical protein
MDRDSMYLVNAQTRNADDIRRSAPESTGVNLHFNVHARAIWAVGTPHPKALPADACLLLNDTYTDFVS